MGIPLFKCANAVGLDKINSKLKEIEVNCEDLHFHNGNSIPEKFVESFLTQQELLAKYLKEEYNEDIEVYTSEYFKKVASGVEPSLQKRFVFITNSDEEIIARLDSTKEGSNIRLETLFVDDRYRGNNLGAWLVGKQVVDCLTEFPATKEFLTNTDKYNDPALKILKKFNFRIQYTIDYFLKTRPERETE